MSQEIDLQISHHQIQIRSIPFLDSNALWNDESVAQGVLINHGHVIFDPVVEGAFAAKIHISLQERYSSDSNALRAMVVPFEVVSVDDLYIASVVTKHKINIGLSLGLYSIYFEICEPDDVDEVYYNLKFTKKRAASEFLKDDDFGGIAGKHLIATS